MITIRRAQEREHVRQRARETWLSFNRNGSDSLAAEFEPLEAFREGRLPPRSASRAPNTAAEIITYVREGTLAYEDSQGRSGLIRAGEFQRMTAGSAVRYEQTNTSPTKWAHVFQVCLRALSGIEPGHEQRRFSVAERRGVLRLVASPDAVEGSLRVHQDAYLYSTMLSRGQHVVHELVDGRSVWLHIVEGALTYGEHTLNTGDGAGITAEHAVSLTANEESEVLLLDLGRPLGKLTAE